MSKIKTKKFDLLSSEKTESNNESEECASFTMFLKHEEILIILGAFIFGMISETFFYPSLTTHLEQNYGLPVKIGSLFFSILSFVYIIALQFLDVTTQKFGLYGTSFIGLIMAALGVYMIFPYYPFPQKIISVIMGLTLIGGGGSPLFIPGLISISNQICFRTHISSSIHFFTLSYFISFTN